MVSIQEAKACLKCGHTRTAADPGPEYACPACGAVYAKVEAALKTREAVQRARETVSADTAARVAGKIEHEAGDEEDGAELRANRAAESNLSTMAHVVYALYVVPVGLTALVGLVIAYVMRGQANGTWIESHFRWQIVTFWGALLSGLVCFFLGTVLLTGSLFAGGGKGAGIGGAMGFGALFVGLLLLIAIWCIYRVAKGWIRLVRDEAVA